MFFSHVPPVFQKFAKTAVQVAIVLLKVEMKSKLPILMSKVPFQLITLADHRLVI